MGTGQPFPGLRDFKIGNICSFQQILQKKVVGCPWYERFKRFISRHAASRHVVYVYLRGQGVSFGESLTQAVCVTTHKGSWVKLLLRLISIVTRSSSHESNPGIKTLLPFLKNITEESDLENFQDLIVALDACYQLHKAISTSLSGFGNDRRCDLADFKRRFSASQRSTVWFIRIFFISE